MNDVTCWSCAALAGPRVVACPECGSLLLLREKYRVVRQLGQGGMGVVFEAIDEPLQRPVALKLMLGRIAADPARRDRFERECRAMAALDHPSIARIYAFDTHRGELLLVQELVRGKSLRALVDDLARGMAPADLLAFTLSIATALLDALAHAHERGVVHRDVNPNNVLLVGEGAATRPVLIDFGLARTANQDETQAAWGGTPGYAAPEQLLESNSNDPRSDVYAVGAIAYALLAKGKKPYADELAATRGDMAALLLLHRDLVEGRVRLRPLGELAPHTPAHVLAAVESALRPVASERPPSARALADALAVPTATVGLALDVPSAAHAPSASTGAPPAISAEPPAAPNNQGASPSARATGPTGPAPRARLVAAALTIALGGVAGYVYTTRPRPEPPAAPSLAAATAAAPLAASPSASALVASAAPERRGFELYGPSGVAVAADGSVLVADRGNRHIKRFRAGSLTVDDVTSEGGAEFSDPRGVTLRSDGVVVVTDPVAHTVFAVEGGRVRRLAGSGAAGLADGDALAASFQAPEAAAVGPDGAVYVADTGNHAIRVVKDGKVSTLAGGTAGMRDSASGPALFSSPSSVAVGPNGAVYVLDHDNRRVRMLQDGKVTTIVQLPPEPPVSGLVPATRRKRRDRLAVGPTGEVYVTLKATDEVRVVRNGQLLPFAGAGTAGSDDGPARTATFSGPDGLAVGPKGEVYVTDADGQSLRVIEQGVVRTLVPGRRGGFEDGPAATARFHAPWGITLSADGSVVVGDWKNLRVRAVRAGAVSTLAGTGTPGTFDGDAAVSQFVTPWSVAAAKTDPGAVYVADGGAHKIRRISQGKVTTFAGSGLARALDGPALVASFTAPEGLTFDDAGRLYVADTGNQKLRVVENGRVTTLAGSGEYGFRDGDALQAAFAGPTALTVHQGVVYVADAQNHRIRAVQSGRVVTVAGLGVPGFRDGDAATAMFHLPAAIAVGADGVLYVADHGNHRIRAIENGVVRTVAGTGRPGWTDGPNALASFANPSDLTFGPDGRLYVADAVNGAIRAITLGAAGRVDTFAGR